MDDATTNIIDNPSYPIVPWSMGKCFFKKKLYIVLILDYNNCSSVIFNLIKGKNEEICHE